MKPLSIEEKAKRYDEALEAVKSLREVNPSDEGIQTWVNENFPELKESEDEKIISAIRKALKGMVENLGNGVTRTACLAWLEKQGKHANFCNEIQIGDKVTRNEDGVLVNLSQLNRVAKKDEKQGKQKTVLSEQDEYVYNEILKRVAVKSCMNTI